jgi:hypothetical protein
MANVTAVQWLLNQLDLYYNGENELFYSDIIEQANAMFDQQIIDAHCDGQYPFENIHNAEQYYKQTFKKD